VQENSISIQRSNQTRRCRALNKFEDDHEDELTFEKEETIVILNEVDENSMTFVLEKDSTKGGQVLVKDVVMLTDLNQENPTLGSESVEAGEEGRFSPILPNS
jgi:hypothetical protein